MLHRHPLSALLVRCALLSISLAAALAPVAQAQDAEPQAVTKLVGSGTSASCTAAALATALVGGGTVRFSCGDAPTTIAVAAELPVTAATTLDGGGRVTLDAGGRGRIFRVNGLGGGAFVLRDITLLNGNAESATPAFGGCIYAQRSRVELSGVIMGGCRAGNGGAVYAFSSPLALSGGALRDNVSRAGGAVYTSDGSTTSVAGTAFSGNISAGDGGAIYAGDSALDVRGATFSGNQAQGTTGAAEAGLGGAIYTHGAPTQVTLADSRFSENSCKNQGGAVFVDRDSALTAERVVFERNSSAGLGGALGTWRSSALVADSSFQGNTAGGGGAVYNGTDAHTTVEGSALGGNEARHSGGAIYGNDGVLVVRASSITGSRAGTDGQADAKGGAIVSYGGQLSVSESTIAGNAAGGARSYGGGVANTGVATIVNTTVTGNSATYAGAIYSKQQVTVSSATLVGNRANTGGALFWESGTTVTLRNTILASAETRSCRGISGAPVDGGGNVQVSDTSCFPSQPVADARLAPLADNGGPTQTMALQAGSAAIARATNCPATDQRGMRRASPCDSGAFEDGSIAGPVDYTERVFTPLVRR